MQPNKLKLEAALALALGDEEFMGNNSKVNKAVEALTPKDTVSAVLKRLQGNARRDVLDKIDSGVTGYSVNTRADKIRQYVSERFKSYMEDPKTSKKATELFLAAYPANGSEPAVTE